MTEVSALLFRLAERIAAWERDMASVLDGCTPATHAETAIMGLPTGVPLHGYDLIGQWQRRAAPYPKDLAHATVVHY